MNTLHILGTGNATVTEVYNTCFAIKLDEEDYLLVDGGGGNGILKQLKKSDISIHHIHHVFLSHAHTDHILGVVWILRIIALQVKRGQYDGNVTIYGHDVVLEKLDAICKLVIGKAYDSAIGNNIILQEVKDGEKFSVLDYPLESFDIESTKEKQFGFHITLKENKRLVFLGDEPYNEKLENYVKDADLLMHEAFCLYSERDIYKPYEKHHATVKDACEIADQLNVKEILMYHTEDKNHGKRKELYVNEGKAAFNGKIHVPDDLEVIEL